jgi:hypothetical protein
MKPSWLDKMESKPEKERLEKNISRLASLKERIHKLSELVIQAPPVAHGVLDLLVAIN